MLANALGKASNTSLTAETIGDAFGTSVSLSGDLIAIGAKYEDSNLQTITTGESSSLDNTSANSGAVYVHRVLTRRMDPDVRVTSTGTTSISFAWGSNLGSATYVTVAPAKSYTSAAPVSPALCSDTGKLDLTAGTAVYTFSGLTTATKYVFRFCSADGGGASEGTVVYASTK